MQWCPILLKNYPWLELIQLWHGVLLKHFKDCFLTLTGLNCSICNFGPTGTLQVRNTSGSSELLYYRLMELTLGGYLSYFLPKFL